LIQLHRRFDGFENDRVTGLTIDLETHHHGDGARRGDGGFLQPLQAGEFPDCGAAAEESAESVAVAAP